MSEHCWDIYFQPGQIIFHVNEDFNVDPQELINWVEGVAKTKGIEVSVSLPADQIFRFNTAQGSNSSTYPRPTSKAYLQPEATGPHWKLPSLAGIFKTAPKARIPPPFSLVFANVKSRNWPNFQAYDRCDENPEAQEAQRKALRELLDLIILLDKNRKSFGPAKLEVVSPNWLMSGGPSSPETTGGPGGKPSSATSTAASQRSFSSKSQFLRQFPQNPNLNIEEAGSITVAILDTSYSIEKLEKIKTNWPQHQLIQNLLGASGALRGANGALNIYPDPIAAQYLPKLRIDGHDYEMTDHGLFVAGIINSVAPGAKLYLYQVLNDYGMGDLSSIVRALQDIMLKFSDRLDKVVINMSLTMNIPLEEKHLKKANDEIGRMILSKNKPEWFWNLIHWVCRILQWILRWFFPRLVLRCRWSWFDRQALPFEWISDLVYVLGPSIIAAAGNNGKNGDRPSALYPAAFDSVLGVGALSIDATPNATTRLTPASYSDLADTPTTQGVAAFGGEDGDGNGVPGVYVGNIPDGRTPMGTPNGTGWAWWAGTSFATPIVSGLVANLVIDSRATSVREAVNLILGSSRDFTPAFEGIIPVEP